MHDQKEKQLFKEFITYFYTRWSSLRRNRDQDVTLFSENRQMSAAEIEVRDQIIRQIYFEFCTKNDYQMISKDERRQFNEADRILIYRANNGMCKMCIDEGKPDRECLVPWAEYEADHVLPHSLGGQTVLENAQVLCRFHNRSKGNRT